MKKNLCEMVFILDKSGSMSGLEKDTVGGFNSMIRKQKEKDGEAYVTTVLFDSNITTVHDRADISKIPELTEKEYFVGGCTALLDAIGSTVEHISKIHRYAREEDVPEHTVFVITTDGMENASRKYSSRDVKEMIGKKREEGWEFIFLAANIDAVETARTFGIDEDQAVDYRCDAAGTALNFECLSEAITNVRKEGRAGAAWKSRIKEDYSRRKG
ncbi:MAG: VWA domain-containing protein [Clostridia bacterium]|nr:VWA domain-containing protein [Clostridia bacterium]